MCSSAVAVEPAGECPLLAISRHTEGSSRTSALPPKADIQSAKSGQGVIIHTDPTCRPTYPLGVVRPHLGLPQWLPLLSGAQGPRIALPPLWRAQVAQQQFQPLRPSSWCCPWAGRARASACPPPQEVEEEAAKAALEPTEVQRETGNRPNGHSRSAIST